MACEAWKLRISPSQHVIGTPTRDGSPAKQPVFKRDVRSLLSGEALEDDLGLAVDAQVLDRLGVRRAGRAVVTAGSVAQRRARGGSGDGLHGCGKRRKRRGEERFPKKGGKKKCREAPRVATLREGERIEF